jgi:hypothetical protein
MRPLVFWSILGLGLVTLAVVSPLFPAVREYRRPPQSAESAIRTILTAQADFRANRRNGDASPKFWRADIAGLYALAPGGGPAIKLIEVSLAAADERPRTDLADHASRAPRDGYWYRSIRHANEDPQALDPNRFAYCAVPDSPEGGVLYVVDERQTVYRAETQACRGIEVFPSDEELRRQWSKVD